MAKPKIILSARERKLITALFKEGKTDKEVAKVVGLQRVTFRKVLKYNKLSFTIARAKETADEKVERSLFERAVGYEHKDTQFFCFQGQIISEEYIKHYPPDVPGATLWLCNRQPNKWKNVAKIDASGLTLNFASVVKSIRGKGGKEDNG